MSVNKVILLGRLGGDPKITALQSGDEIASFSVATSEKWKDKNSGEVKDKTQWHNVVIFNQPLVKLAKNYLAKGVNVYIEGKLENRDWVNKDGVKMYTTEVVLRPYDGKIDLIDSKIKRSDDPVQSHGNDDDLADDIPF